MAPSGRRIKTIGVLFRTLKFNSKPFSKEKIRKSYEVLSRLTGDINFLISTFDNFSNNHLKKAFVFDKQWKVVENQKIDLIFDRMRSSPETNKLKQEISKQIKIINNPELSKICWDKLKTYELFPDLIPKTTLGMSELKTGKIILKPRYGIMGKDIKLIDKNQIKKLDKDFIAQQFIDNSSGIAKLNIKGVHDLRVIVIDGEIDHCYARVAQKNSLTSNCARGGKKIFIDKIPLEIIKIVKKVDSRLNKYNPRIYSIDFVYDKQQKPWIVELESMPGFAYYDNAEETRIKFLNKIVSLLKK